jgi:hypothetical protein
MYFIADQFNFYPVVLLKPAITTEAIKFKMKKNLNKSGWNADFFWQENLSLWRLALHVTASEQQNSKLYLRNLC